MLKVKLIENGGLMKVKEYKLTYPFNLLSDNDNETYYNLNSFEYINIKDGRGRVQKGGAFGAGMALGMFLPQILGTASNISKVNI